MAYDLSQPRPILPFPHLNTSLQYPATSSASASLACTTDAPRRAIALRLNEHVLKQIAQLVKQERKLGGAAGQQATKGSIRIDLGSNPALIVNGISYPLTLDPTSSESSPGLELVRSSRHAAQPLQPIATVDHRATIKPGSGAQGARDIARVGHALRENRDAVEKEREGRRAVLLESSAPLSRSTSLQRLNANSAGSAASASTSRTSSTSLPRQPSRLIAVPLKPPPGSGSTTSGQAAARAPSSSFRMGKSATIAATATSGTAPDEPVGGSVPAAIPVAATSPSESSPAESSSSQHSSHVHSHASVSSTGQTSISSTSHSAEAASPAHESGNLSGAVTRVAGGGVMKGKDSLKKEKRKEERVSSTKKEKIGSSPVKSGTSSAKTASPSKSVDVEKKGSESQVKSKIRLVESESSGSEGAPLAATSLSSASTVKSASKKSATDGLRKESTPPVTKGTHKRLSSAAEIVSDVESKSGEPTESSKKKRKLLNGLDSGADEPPGTISSSSRAPTPISSPRLPPIPRIKRKVALEDESGKSKADPSSLSTSSKRGKKRQKEERWYSSSSDEDAEGEPEPPEEGEVAADSRVTLAPSSASSRNKRRRTISAPEGGLGPDGSLAQGTASDSEVASRGRPRSALPTHMAHVGRKSAPGSPLRASSVAPAAGEESREVTPLYPATLPRDVSYSDLVAHFTALYKTYSSLHHLLMCEKQALEGGEPGDFELATTARMVKRLEGVRSELEGTRRRMENWDKDKIVNEGGSAAPES